jgi:hypothetical protein
MSASRRIFKVFLASPSDVAKERRAAEEIVEWVNKSVANELGWQVEIHLWEETLPLFCRPQVSINPLVDECDLFIGQVARSCRYRELCPVHRGLIAMSGSLGGM